VSFLTPSLLPTQSSQVDHTIDYSIFDWQMIWLEGTLQRVCVFLPIGLYGKIPVYFSQSQLTAVARRLHGSVLPGRLDYASRRETLFRGSLGSGGNVCTMPFPLWFNYSHLLALWSPPCIWLPCLYLMQRLTKPLRRWYDCITLQVLGAGTHLLSRSRMCPHPTTACLRVYVSVLFT
jgi:hypothetical protein